MSLLILFFAYWLTSIPILEKQNQWRSEPLERESVSLICMVNRILIFVLIPVIAYTADSRPAFWGTIAFVSIACLYHSITYMRRLNQPKQDSVK